MKRTNPVNSKIQNKKGFTLLELTISMGLWIILLGAFMASFLFGIRNMPSNFDEINEYTRVSLFFDALENILKENNASASLFDGIENTLLIQYPDGRRSIVYFYNSNDKALDETFESDTYQILLQDLGKKQDFIYGRGRKLMEKVNPPPLSHFTINKQGYVLLHVRSSFQGFGPYQTMICAQVATQKEKSKIIHKKPKIQKLMDSYR